MPLALSAPRPVPRAGGAALTAFGGRAFTPGAKSPRRPALPADRQRRLRRPPLRRRPRLRPRRPTGSTTGTRTTITAVATQDLSRFSLDFQRDLDRFGGQRRRRRRRRSSRADAKPKLSDDPQRDPAGEADRHARRPGSRTGEQFSRRRRLPGAPERDRRRRRLARGLGPGLLERRALRRLASRSTSRSARRAGSRPTTTPRQGDLRDLHTTAPDAYTALGGGELVSRINNGDGTDDLDLGRGLRRRPPT